MSLASACSDDSDSGASEHARSGASSSVEESRIRLSDTEVRSREHEYLDLALDYEDFVKTLHDSILRSEASVARDSLRRASNFYSSYEMFQLTLSALRTRCKEEATGVDLGLAWLDNNLQRLHPMVIARVSLELLAKGMIREIDVLPYQSTAKPQPQSEFLKQILNNLEFRRNYVTLCLKLIHDAYFKADSSRDTELWGHYYAEYVVSSVAAAISGTQVLQGLPLDIQVTRGETIELINKLANVAKMNLLSDTPPGGGKSSVVSDDLLSYVVGGKRARFHRSMVLTFLIQRRDPIPTLNYVGLLGEHVRDLGHYAFAHFSRGLLAGTTASTVDRWLEYDVNGKYSWLTAQVRRTSSPYDDCNAVAVMLCDENASSELRELVAGFLVSLQNDEEAQRRLAPIARVSSE